jgi:hypothetical protein
MPKRLNIIFCAPKCAPNGGKRLCWQKKSKHSVQRGCDVFTFQANLAHSSGTTTGNYVAANHRDSSSLRLGQCTELLTATLY